jgi:hypothetical protein
MCLYLYMSEWLIPASIKNCLDNNLSFKLTHKLGNKRIFTSDDIKRLILEEAGYITVPPSHGYVFNKYTGPAGKLDHPPPSAAYYKKATLDITPLTTGTYHITNYNKNKELWSITIQDASSSEYISSATGDIMISIYYAKGAAEIGHQQIIRKIVDNPSLQTVVNYYSFKVTIDNFTRILSSSNNYTDSRCGFTIPHWESSGGNLCYYGALSQMTSGARANVTIIIGPTVVLPFGLSNLKIANITTTSDLPDKYLYLNSARLSALGIISLDLSKDRKSKFLKDVIVSQSSGTPLNAVTIKGGGIIYGGIIADTRLVTQLDIPRYNYSMSGTPRADKYAVASSINPPITTDAINSIQYWTLAGLLEINAKTIIIDNISVVGGIPRGISATQLNAYNITGYTDPSRSATITNSDFVLNTYSNGQADGLDSLCTNIFKNLYIQAIDDCFKIASNTTATNITILSGSAGGAINIGAYGYNKPIDQPVDVSNIYLHELDKTRVGDGCKSQPAIPPNNYWPGPSVIFAPYYPTNSNQIIGPIYIQNIYYPVKATELNHWDASDTAPFFSGGFLSAGFDPSEPLITNLSFAIHITTDISSAENLSNNYVYSNMVKNKIINTPMTGHISVIINKQPPRVTSECTNSIPDDHPNQSWNVAAQTTAQTITYIPSYDTKIDSKCIDLLGADTRLGGIINLWNCNSQVNQKWLWESSTNRIKYYNEPSKCIDLPGGDPTPGNKLWLWDCNEKPNQEWLYDQNTNQIRYNADPSMCIDVPSGITIKGSQLQLWNCNK